MIMGLKPANDDVKGRPWFESDVSRQWWLDLDPTVGYGLKLVNQAKAWEAKQASRSGREIAAPVLDDAERNKGYANDAANESEFIFSVTDADKVICGITGDEMKVKKSYRRIKVRLSSTCYIYIYIDTGASGCYITNERIAEIQKISPESIVSSEKYSENYTCQTYDASPWETPHRSRLPTPSLSLIPPTSLVTRCQH